MFTQLDNHQHLLQLFDTLSLREKIIRTLHGLREHPDSGEHKWARLQILRLWSPTSAIAVPVLVLPDGSVIDESFDILLWALAINDPDDWLHGDHSDLVKMVAQNDGEFKKNLDGYKYPQRNTGKTHDEYRGDGARWLALLDKRLRSSKFLNGDAPSALDIAIMPFIRQFANTDPGWFEASPYASLGRWLGFWKD